MQKRPIFQPSFGNKPEKVVGRDDVIGRLLDGLGTYPGSRERTSLITGQRGMGKTALLLAIAEQAESRGFVVARTTCGMPMLDNLIDTLQRKGERYVATKKPPIKGFNAGALGFSVGLTFTDSAREQYGFRMKLEMICERLAQVDREVVLLIDEVQPDSVALRELVTAYQEIVGEGYGISLVMAGLPSAVSGVLNEKTLTFLERATKISLGMLPLGTVRAYYGGAFKRAGRKVDGEMLTSLAEATQGFPYLLQLIGFYALEYTQKGDAITPAILAEAERCAQYDLDANVYAAMLKPLTRADVSFLRAMALDNGPTHVADLEGRLGVSQGHVQSYRRRLIDAGVVESPERGMLAFCASGLADYLRRTEG